MKIIKGNLIGLALSGNLDVIIHGCNCFNTMGGGIALQIKNTFPEAFSVDSLTQKGSRDKLGTISVATIKRNDLVFDVVNAYTQFNYGRNSMNVDYEAVRSCLKLVKQLFTGKRIGYPKIGAGLAGGDWGILEKIFDEELEGEDHTLVVFD